MAQQELDQPDGSNERLASILDEAEKTNEILNESTYTSAPVSPTLAYEEWPTNAPVAIPNWNGILFNNSQFEWIDKQLDSNLNLPIRKTNEYLVGWRVSVYKNYRLTSPIKSDIVWTPVQPMKAECRNNTTINGSWPVARRQPDEHESPYKLCKCGIYACTTPFTAVTEWNPNRYMHKNIFLVKVALWGRVFKHKSGYRAEYAYPLEVWTSRMWWTRKIVSAIYNVPVHYMPSDPNFDELNQIEKG